MTKKLNIPIILLLLLIATLTFVSCKLGANPENGANIHPTKNLHKPTNSVYYWRTVYNPSADELDFLKKQKIGRMYLRMFDVVMGTSQPEPNATIKFNQQMPNNIEIVPTVFITVDAMEGVSIDSGVPDLATKIVDRIDHICSWNEISNWHEIQLDCDWTEQTRDKFFCLCKVVRDKLPKDKLLSSTIRLHQLRQPAPPVDYGVLMVYNTDNFMDSQATNSILNDETVEQYLTSKFSFDLPLDIALPIYQWNLVFDQDGNFLRISYTDQYDDDEVMKFENVPYSTLLQTNEVLKRYLHLQPSHYSKILYHLDNQNINHYSDEQITNLYNN